MRNCHKEDLKRYGVGLSLAIGAIITLSNLVDPDSRRVAFSGSRQIVNDAFQGLIVQPEDTSIRQVQTFDVARDPGQPLKITPNLKAPRGKSPPYKPGPGTVRTLHIGDDPLGVESEKPKLPSVDVWYPNVRPKHQPQPHVEPLYSKDVSAYTG